MNVEPFTFGTVPKEHVSSFLSDEAWFGASNTNMQTSDEAFQGSAEALRRVQSASAIPFSMSDKSSNWDSHGSVPLPIRPTRRAAPEDFSSLESSQSLLTACHGGSFTDDSTILKPAPRVGSAPQRYPTGYNVRLTAEDALAAIELSFVPTAPQPPVRIPAPGGHWAWVPESSADPAPAPPPPPPAAPNMVPVNSGPLPLPVPTNYGGLSLPTAGNDDLMVDFLDEFDVMAMADSLTPAEEAAAVAAATNMGFHYKRAVGSCPLPTLLEDSLSAENDGSDDTMHHTVPPSFSLDRSASGTLTSSGSRGSHRSGVPIPGTRSIPLKVSGPPRCASHPHLSSALASSLPDRPMRTAARRSLAVTAAALRDNVDDSDSDASEGGMRTQYNASARRATSHQVNRQPNHHGSAAAKKKHNPWSLEETLALVEGVRLTGVGKWAEIKRLPVPGVADVLETRTPVDLKDKWRNLTRVARLPKAALRQRLQRGPSDIPLETMLTVKHLMEAGQDAE